VYNCHVALKHSISIVIPSYNEQVNLAACLNAIAQQTILPDQVIVVDNNSTDKTAEIAKRYTFVEIIEEHKQGIFHANHTGFNYAQSDLIARIDADTILPQNWVERVLDFYPDNELHVTLVGSGYFYNLKAPRITNSYIKMNFWAGKILLGHYPLWGPNLVMPREVWNDISDTLHSDRDIFDDLDLSLHIYTNNHPIRWDKSLKVGVAIRHCNNAVELWHYTQRWPRTIMIHQDRRWVVAWIGTAVGLIPLYIFLRLLKKD